MKPALIDAATAAVELGVSARTVRRLVVQDGLLTNYGTPRQILIRLDEVVRLEGYVGAGRQPRRSLRRLRGLQQVVP